MTWVIGVPGLLSRGCLFGDVRITLRDRQGRVPDREIEGVRKIHEISPNIAMGFAGNVDTGFKMVGDLRATVAASIPPNTMLTEPSRFLLKWARRTRHAWRLLDAAERVGGCELVAIAALPPVGPTTPTAGWILRAPQFEPERILHRRAASIGSGAHVNEYASGLERIEDDFPGLLAFVVSGFAGIGGPLLPLAVVISEVIEGHEAPGISPHLIICSVRFGAVELSTNDVQGMSPNATSRTMPPIAHTFSDWQVFKADHGLADAVAVA
jgi:hypothetical protein